MTERARRKEEFNELQRLHLVELDLDVHDEAIHEVADAVKELGVTVSDRLNRIMWAVLSLALSLVTATVSVVLARGR